MPALDDTDARLLQALDADPRASVSALAQRLGLARNTVQARLSRLEAGDALLPFSTRVRPAALGHRLEAYLTLQVAQRSLTDVGAALAAVPEVVEVIALSGAADLLVHVVAVDAEDLWRLTEQVLALPGVERTDTALALRRLVDRRVGPLLRRAAGDSDDAVPE